MKNLNFLKPVLFAFAILSLASCDRENRVINAIEDLNEEEMVALIEGALSTTTEGLSKAVEDAVELTEEYIETVGEEGLCDLSADTLMTRDYNGARVNSSYNLSWDWDFECSDLMIPQSLAFSRTIQGNYESLRLLSEDSGSSSWTLSNLVGTEDYSLNGSYSREGQQESKVRAQNNFESLISIHVPILNVDKNTLRISSGEATFLISGDGSGGYNFSYEGTILFLGDGSAEVTINGTTYTIDLY